MPGKTHTDQFAFPLTAESFEELFRAHYSRLCLFANHFINDFDTAEDLVQDLFIAVWNKRDTIHFTGSASAYLYTALRHKCYNHLRDQKHVWSLGDHLPEQVDLQEGEEAREEEQRAIIAAETFQRVHELLQQLPSKCRTVAQLALIDNKSAGEIADELSISESTVRNQKARALTFLRGKLRVVFLKIFFQLL